PRLSRPGNGGCGVTGPATNRFDATAVSVLQGERSPPGFTLACGSVRWFCAQTPPHREALARDRLQHLGFTAFLPTVAREVRHARRVEVVARPLFPRYVFLAFGPTAG